MNKNQKDIGRKQNEQA